MTLGAITNKTWLVKKVIVLIHTTSANHSRVRNPISCPNGNVGYNTISAIAINPVMSENRPGQPMATLLESIHRRKCNIRAIKPADLTACIQPMGIFIPGVIFLYMDINQGINVSSTTEQYFRSLRCFVASLWEWGACYQLCKTVVQYFDESNKIHSRDTYKITIRRTVSLIKWLTFGRVSGSKPLPKPSGYAHRSYLFTFQ